MTPPPLKFNVQVIDIDFHPSLNILSSALINGKVTFHSYSDESNTLSFSHRYHKQSCRSLQYSLDGNILFTTSSDGNFSFIDSNSGKILQSIQNAHEEPISALKVIDEKLIVTGDDAGNINFWDIRKKEAVVSFTECIDFISDFAFDPVTSTLFSTRHYFDSIIVCCLFLVAMEVFNWNYIKPSVNIANFIFLRIPNSWIDSNDELLSLAIINKGKKVICGTQKGSLNMFNIDQWERIHDCYSLQAIAIDSLVSPDDNTLIIGSFDGIIRKVFIQPKKAISELGTHGDFPIEKIKLSFDKNILGSSSHDKTIKFWNLSESSNPPIPYKKNKGIQKSTRVNPPNDFFNDL